AREMMNARLGGSIHGSHLEPDLSEIRTDVDDAPATLRDHNLCRCLTCEEDALEGGCHCSIELLFRHVQRCRCTRPTCIIHKDVEASESVLDLLHEGLQLGDVRNVGGHNDRLSSKCLDFRLDLADFALPPCWVLCKCDMGTRPC